MKNYKVGRFAGHSAQSFTSSFFLMLRAKNYQNRPLFHDVVARICLKQSARTVVIRTTKSRQLRAFIFFARDSM